MNAKLAFVSVVIYSSSSLFHLQQKEYQLRQIQQIHANH